MLDRSRSTDSSVSPVRLMLLAVVLLSMLCFSGILFGWSQLVPVMEADHVGRARCESSTFGSATETEPCPEQLGLFNGIYTVASSVQIMSSLPIGVAVDRLGPSRCAILAGILVVSGMTTLSVADREEGSMYYPAMTALGLGGAMTMMMSFKAAFVVPQWQNLIMTAVNVLFGSSVGVTLAFRSAHSAGLSSFVLWLGLACLAVVVYVSLFILWRKIAAHTDTTAQLTSSRDGIKPHDSGDNSVVKLLPKGGGELSSVAKPGETEWWATAASASASPPPSSSAKKNEVEVEWWNVPGVSQASRSTSGNGVSTIEMPAKAEPDAEWWNVAGGGGMDGGAGVGLRPVGAKDQAPLVDHDDHKDYWWNSPAEGGSGRLPEGSVEKAVAKVDQEWWDQKGDGVKLLHHQGSSSDGASTSLMEPDVPVHVEQAASDVAEWSLDLRDASLRQQLCSRQFVFLASYMSIMSMKSNWYLSQARSILQEQGAIGDNDTTLAVFGICVMMGWIFSPVITASMSRWSWSTCFQLVNILAILHGGLTLVGEHMPVSGQYCNFGVFAFFKAFMYSLTASFAAETFGNNNLATIMGAMYLSVGITNLLSYPLAIICIVSGTYFAVNLGLTLSSVPFFGIAPLWCMGLHLANTRRREER